MTEIKDKLKLLKDIGKYSKDSKNHKATLEIKQNIATGEMTVTNKISKKDHQEKFSELNEAAQTAEILMWSRCNIDVWQHIVQEFIKSHSKAE